MKKTSEAGRLAGFYLRDDLGMDSISIRDNVTEGAREPLHWHRYLQIGVCTGGAGKFAFTNKVYDVHEGDVFVVGSFENHVAFTEPPESLFFLFALFTPEYIAPPGSRQFEHEYLHVFRYNPAAFDNKIPAGDPAAARICELVARMKKVQDEARFGYEHALDALLRTVLADLMDYYYNKKDHDAFAVDAHNFAKMREALDYLHGNFLKNVTLADLSDLLHISESRFRHLFKETIRIGFKEYITYLRLSEARRLLISSDFNVSDVALASGFSNIHQFYKVFYQYVFMSPAEYRSLYKPDRTESAKSRI